MQRIAANAASHADIMTYVKMIENYNELEDDAMAAGIDIGELEFMDPDEKATALEEAGLDSDDYDLY